MFAKKLLSLFLVVLFSIIFLFNDVFAFSGWNYIDGEYCYLNNEGRKILNVWRESDGKLYYLGDDGNMVRNRVFEYDGYLYCVNEYGVRVTDLFVIVTKEMHPNDNNIKDGVYYFDDKGRAFKRKDNVFKKTISNATYCFDEDGIVVGGWLDKDGNEITDNSLIITEGMYHTDKDGRLFKNTWYNFSDDVGSLYTEDIKSSYMADEYDDLHRMWVYFDDKGRKVVAENGNKVKNKTINGKKYAFDNYGIMTQGFSQNDDVDYHQQSNPTMTSKVKMYDKKDGYLLKNEWVRTAPSVYLSNEEFYDDEKSWYYANNNGEATYNKLKSINSKKYVFDGLGRMKTGFALIDRKSYFVASYKPEDLVRNDFIYSFAEGGHLYGSELSNLYFFGEDEESDGTMKTGTMKIELDDGIYEFLFRPSGVAMGANNILKKYRDSYYINGLKLTPIEDMKYGIVKVSNEEYVVVNQNGKLVKNRKKVLKDDYDGNMIIINDKLVGYIPAMDSSIKIKWVGSMKKGMETVFVGPGYYYYNSDSNVKKYTGIAVPSGKQTLTADELALLEKDHKVNFK